MGALPRHVCPQTVKALKVRSPYLFSTHIKNDVVQLCGFRFSVCGDGSHAHVSSQGISPHLETPVCVSDVSTRHFQQACPLHVSVLELQLSVQAWSSLCLSHPRKWPLWSSHGSGQVLPVLLNSPLSLMPQSVSLQLSRVYRYLFTCTPMCVWV